MTLPNTKTEQGSPRTWPKFIVSLCRKLYVQVIIAVVGGATVGFLYPKLGTDLKPLGDGFIKAIKVVVTPIVFVTIAVGIGKMGDIKRVAVIGLKTLIYFEVASTLALIIGIIVGNVWLIGAQRIPGHALKNSKKYQEIKIPA